MGDSGGGWSGVGRPHRAKPGDIPEQADYGARRSFTREQLETIADEVAGVARNGIQALRQAALRAE